MTRPLPSSSPMRITPEVRASMALLRGRAGLEQLDDPGQTAGDVTGGAGDAAGVEGPHRQLGAGLADRLGRDDADRLAVLDRLAGGQRQCRSTAAEMPSSLSSVSGESTRTRVTSGSSRSAAISVSRSTIVPALHDRAVGQLDVVGQGPAEQPGLEVEALGRRVGADVLDPDAADRAAAVERVLVVDDELLGHVDETTGQVARVGGTERRVDEALAGARGGDEVLQHVEALTEVRLDRAGDHVTTGVGHQATHAGDLADLHHVAASTRAHHHLDGVELLRP